MTVDAGALIRTLRDGGTADRMAAAANLAALGPAALPPLLPALDDPDPRLRMWAAYTLGMIGDAGAVPALVQALEDADPGVTRWAAAALRRIRDADGGCGCRFC
ncbi:MULTISPECIES: HEAT repeat domain-containing protein [Methanoculleus]|uniref:PBS lyase HEAT domain protein repeat-containing protein n=2 Tax=Methanoculleus TaxID=45989 RepID=A3CYD2_METMJ|nr:MULTISPECIES: HEAT repeat domain-containing protein [Methanoculleus]ABN58382.1 PBS lyase HEAT domain protein repeat-containing protein [Methanoculleus marisnigri JR1]UYU17380.1 HEAT repeat domain-containing protein [Methanoculleus submarinus]